MSKPEQLGVNCKYFGKGHQNGDVYTECYKKPASHYILDTGECAIIWGYDGEECPDWESKDE